MASEAKIGELFARLRLRYGAKIRAAYPDTSVDDLAQDWAGVLHDIPDSAIEYGITNLPIEWPPTAMAFRALCRQAPSGGGVEDDAFASELLPCQACRTATERRTLSLLGSRCGHCYGEYVRRPLDLGPDSGDKRTDPKAWARALRQREAAGEPINSTQKAMWRAALGEGGEADVSQDRAEKQRTEELKAGVQRQVDAFQRLNPGAYAGGWDQDRRDAHQRSLEGGLS